MADLANPVDQIETAQAQKEVTANELFDAASIAMLYGRRGSTCNLLTWGYYGGRADSVSIAHGTVTLTASNTNYIVARKSTGAVSVSTSNTNWNNTTDYTRLYKVFTNGTGPDPAQPWEDHRQALGASAPAGAGVTATDVTFDDTGLVYINAADVQDAIEDLDAAIAAAGSALTVEQVQDIIGALIVAGSNITATYDDAGSPPTLSIAGTRVPAVQTVASSATVTPTFANDLVTITAQAAGLTLANPTGSALEGWGIVIRIKDNGTSRSITYGTQYRAIGVTLPANTVISKTLYLAMIFNNTDTKWDVLAVGQEA